MVDIKFDPTKDQLRQRVVDSEWKIEGEYEKFQKLMIEHLEWQHSKDGGNSQDLKQKLGNNEFKKMLMRKYGNWNANGSTNFTDHFKNQMLIDESSSSSLKSVQIFKQGNDCGTTDVLMDKFVAIRDRGIGF